MDAEEGEDAEGFIQELNRIMIRPSSEGGSRSGVGSPPRPEAIWGGAGGEGFTYTQS